MVIEFGCEILIFVARNGWPSISEIYLRMKFSDFVYFDFVGVSLSLINYELLQVTILTSLFSC